MGVQFRGVSLYIDVLRKSPADGFESYGNNILNSFIYSLFLITSFALCKVTNALLLFESTRNITGHLNIGVDWIFSLFFFQKLITVIETVTLVHVTMVCYIYIVYASMNCDIICA